METVAVLPIEDVVRCCVRTDAGFELARSQLVAGWVAGGWLRDSTVAGGCPDYLPSLPFPTYTPLAEEKLRTGRTNAQ